MRIIAFFIALGITGISYAERIIPLSNDSFVGQPVFHLTEGKYSSCGIRIIGLTSPATNNPKELVWVADASFMITNNGIGLTKALLFHPKSSDVLAVNTNLPIVEFDSFWLKGEGSSATTPLDGKISKGENKGSKIYAISSDSFLGLMNSLGKDSEILIGYKFKNGGEDFALRGKITLSKPELVQFSSCMKEMLASIQEK